MSDTNVRTDNRSSGSGMTEKLQQTGEDLKERASEAYNATADAARESFDQLGAAARETASRAADKMGEQVSAQQHAGADFVVRFAENIRNAAKAFEQDTPVAARSIEMAAGYVEEAADKMRDTSMREMVDGATTFARQHPAAFLGLSVLAGFAMVRFLKASGGSSGSGRSGSQDYGPYDEFGEAEYRAPGSYASSSTNREAPSDAAWRPR